MQKHIRPFTNADLNDFMRLFQAYFQQDLKLNIPENELKAICNEIANGAKSGIIPLDLLFVNESLVGFVEYQIDSKKSDWCEREGWGFIREVYINKSLRGKGFGKKLVEHAVNKLHSLGVKDIYLTSDNNEIFWNSCGFTKTDSVSENNQDTIYIATSKS